MKITAAILEQINQPLTLCENITIPTLRKGQVLIKLDYSGVCHSQLMEVQGRRGEDKFLPHMLGHEGVGRVVAVGEKVQKISVGDDVILGWIKSEGIDAGGCKYLHNEREINAGAVTTFSNYAVVSENRLVKLPKGINKKTAVLLGCALPTGAGIVLNQLKPKIGKSVGVYGLGGIGLSALLALKHFEPSHVIAFDIEESKLILAKELGATHCYEVGEQGRAQFLIDFPEGIDYIVEAAGKTSTIEAAFSLVKKGGGKCIFASHPPSGETIQLDPFDLICGKQIEGSWGGASKPDKDIPFIVDIINKYTLPVEKLLSNEYSLMDINQALTDLEQRKITRALIHFENLI
ncbi:alcohol dehydrogenase catalytic domain-containing protein [Colwellia sp. RE-S-Sl-9]